jgi:5-oxoprolinase (ATP-hydrolysing) subunit A
MNLTRVEIGRRLVGRVQVCLANASLECSSWDKDNTEMVVINCDMGESFGLYKMGDDEGLMPEIDIANVACGFHGSDFNHMRKTVRLAKQHGVKVGAHPSLPDLQGFGRREMKIGREELTNCLLYQIGALNAFLDAEGVTLNHIKPHGALYGMAARMEEIAEAVADAADVYKVPLFGMKGTLHEKIYRRRGHTFVAEYYADLDYNAEGGLIITREHDAKDPSDAAARCLRALTEGKTRSVAGNDVAVGSDAICVHSDTPNAVAIAQAVREALRPYLATR